MATLAGHPTLQISLHSYALTMLGLLSQQGSNRGGYLGFCHRAE